MTPHLLIEPARPGHDLRALWQEVYETDHLPLLPEGARIPFEPRGDAYAATINGAIAGFCYVDADWLDEVWIAKAWQGRGIGSGLISFAENIMRLAGTREAFLSVFTANMRAIALYRRLGWVPVRTFIPRGTALSLLKMAKHL